MRDEERGREQADHDEGNVVVGGQRIGDGAGVRDVPREASTDGEARCDATSRGGQTRDSGGRRYPIALET
jgi:hypothetical protein